MVDIPEKRFEDFPEKVDVSGDDILLIHDENGVKKVKVQNVSSGSSSTLVFENITISPSDFQDNPDSDSFPYKIELPLQGVDSDHIPNVYFDLDNATSGVFAPVAVSGTNKVTIYATEVVDGDIIIPTISCTKGTKGV